MLNRASTALVSALAIFSAAPAIAADGQVVITQAKANAGNVTPGDAPGFPVTLSRPVSYILASNLHPLAGKAGIEIASDRVTIDLNGFSLSGAAGATFGINGGAFESATIRNGTIAGFQNHGIFGTGKNWIVEDVRVIENGADGIHASGIYTSVRNSGATENGGDGIRCGARCLVADNNSSGNGAYGVALSSGTVLGNVIISNAGFGVNGGSYTGSGNNTLAFNNGGGAQVSAGVDPLHPNVCVPACP